MIVRTTASLSDRIILHEQVHRVCVHLPSCDCSNRFEPFGGLKSAFNLAKQSKEASTTLEMTEVYRRSRVVEHDPDYQAPSLQDIEIICVAFDVLHNGKEASQAFEDLRDIFVHLCTPYPQALVSATRAQEGMFAMPDRDCSAFADRQ